MMPRNENPDQEIERARLIRNLAEVLEIGDRGRQDGYLTFRGNLRMPPSRAIRRLTTIAGGYGLTPFLSRDSNGEGTVLLRLAPVKKKRVRERPLLHLALLIATFFTTLIAWSWVNENSFSEILRRPLILAEGLAFSISLLVILGLHELSHYLVSRMHGIRVSLPYFIPFPNILGTMGAVIVGRSAFLDRKSLFDVGIAGPLASFFLSVLALVIGLQSSEIIRPVITSRTILIGESLLYHYIARLHFPSIPSGYTYSVTPMMFAGWVGLFVTALNLLPMGQLDGGHISYALFGKKHGTITLAVMAFLVLVGLVFQSPIWLLIGILTLILGRGHAPPLDDITPLNPARKLLGVLALLILLSCFTPVPLRIY